MSESNEHSEDGEKVPRHYQLTVCAGVNLSVEEYNEFLGRKYAMQQLWPTMLKNERIDGWNSALNAVLSLGGFINVFRDQIETLRKEPSHDLDERIKELEAGQ